MTVQLPIYQGQFGNFSITQSDRLEVIIYRLGLGLASLSFCAGGILILWQGLTNNVLQVLTPLFFLFIISLGVSLQTIHIYLKPLHQLLKLFWLIGTLSTIFFCINSEEYLVILIKNQHLSLLGIGFIFASLTGIFVKEAFCFNRLEAKFLSLIIPTLLLGYIIDFLPLNIEQILLTNWVVLFFVFIFRKSIQEIPPDIGDKSVFDYLKNIKNKSLDNISEK